MFASRGVPDTKIISSYKIDIRECDKVKAGVFEMTDGKQVSSPLPLSYYTHVTLFDDITVLL